MSRYEGAPELWRDASVMSGPSPSVLVGYDGSITSRHALAYAAGMARRTGQRLLVAYIAQPPPYVFGNGCVAPFQDPDEVKGWLRRELADVIDSADLDIDVVTRYGDPARWLADLGAENRADAIVLGASQQWLHRLVGSVPGWVARHATCPVIVVP